MTQGNTDFKKRLKKAIDSTIEELALDHLRVQRLYTPVWRDKAYRWISPMDSDGLLLKERKIHEGEEPPPAEVKMRVGVIIQSEFTTSATKPNPFGKALVGSVPLGVWVDVVDGDGARRVRLDQTFVLFILPNAKAWAKKKISDTARNYVENATDASGYAHVLEVDQGTSAKELAKAISARVRPWLIGAGRPKG